MQPQRQQAFVHAQIELTAHLRALTETNFWVCTFCVNRSSTRTHRECACTELPAQYTRTQRQYFEKSPAVRSLTRTHRDKVMSVHVLGYPLRALTFRRNWKTKQAGFLPKRFFLFSFFRLVFGWLVPTFLFPAVFGSFLDGFRTRGREDLLLVGYWYDWLW